MLKDRLYTARDGQPRAALGADGAGADPRRAAEADGADPVVHRRGGVARSCGRTIRRSSRTCGRTPAGAGRRTRADRQVGADPRGARRGAEGARGRCARPARSARRCRRRSRSRRPQPEYAALASLGDDLRFVSITSAATVDRRRTRSRSTVTPSATPEVRALLALARRRRRRSRRIRRCAALRGQSLRRRRAAPLRVGDHERLTVDCSRGG